MFFKPDGTKLSIQGNSITFSEPDFTQGVNRYLNNDKSIDITKLYIPILKCLSRFKLNDDYKFLFNISIQGLEKLKKCYSVQENTNYSTLTTINSYIALIKAYINGNRLDEDNIYINTNDYNIWKESDIKLITNYFHKLEENNSDSVNKNYIRVISHIAELKENIAYDMINKAVELF